MSLEFEYKTAPLGAVRRLIVEPDEVCLADAAGEVLERMRLADVDSGRFVETHVRRMALRRIDLHAGDSLLRVPLNTSSGTDASEEPLATFYRGSTALLRALSEVQPELELEFGETTRARAWMFGIGLFAILLGAGLPILALATGVSGDKLAGAAIPMAVLLLFGVFLARANRPWMPMPRVTSAQLAAVLSALATAGDEDAE